MHSQSNCKIAQCARAVKEMGVEVQELMRQESNNRKQRARTLKNDEMDSLDEIVTKILAETKALLQRLTKQSKMAVARENKLVAAIEKKKNDIEKNYKLLASLNIGVHSTHKAEYNQLEEELQVEYERYVAKIRNIDYLESELRSYHSQLLQQRERAARRTRRMQDAYREETFGMLEGEANNVESVKREDSFATNRTLSDHENTEPSQSDDSLSAPSCDNLSDSIEGEVYDSDSSNSNF